MKFLFGKKVGMTRIYNDAGKAVPVTVIEAGPVFVVRIDKDDAQSKIQLGFGDAKHLNKPAKGHLSKNGQEKPLKHLKELHISEEETQQFKPGQTLTVDSFAQGDIIDINSVSKGKGFAGVIKRHGFHSGPKTHGSDHHRAPGSIGSAYPQRVVKGKKMPGHLGARQTTVKKLTVVEIHPQDNLLVVSGSIPGARGSLVSIKGVE